MTCPAALKNTRSFPARVFQEPPLHLCMALLFENPVHCCGLWSFRPSRPAAQSAQQLPPQRGAMLHVQASVCDSLTQKVKVGVRKPVVHPSICQVAHMPWPGGRKTWGCVVKSPLSYPFLRVVRQFFFWESAQGVEPTRI